MNKADREVLKTIRDIRYKNNMHWMKIVEIAIDHAPVETKLVMLAINDNDRAISSLWERLAR